MQELDKLEKEYFTFEESKGTVSPFKDITDYSSSIISGALTGDKLMNTLGNALPKTLDKINKWVIYGSTKGRPAGPKLHEYRLSYWRAISSCLGGIAGAMNEFFTDTSGTYSKATFLSKNLIDEKG